MPAQPSMADIRNAIMAWIAAGISGFQMQFEIEFGSESIPVIWADQNTAAPPPATDYISLRIASIVGLGSMHDMNRYQNHLADNPPPNPGEEIGDVNGGTAELTLSIQAFSAPQDGTLASEEAYEWINAIRRSLFSPTIRDALNDVGLSPFDYGAVQNISAIAGSEFEGRAALDVKFYVPDTNEDLIGYITTVNGSVTLHNAKEGDLTVPIAVTQP